MGLAPPAAGPREKFGQRQDALFSLPATVLLITKSQPPLVAESLKSTDTEPPPFAPENQFAPALDASESCGPRKICFPEAVVVVIAKVATRRAMKCRCANLMYLFILGHSVQKPAKLADQRRSH